MEQEVFEGIGEVVWPKIQQIVAEVHDVETRVAELTALFAEKGFKRILISEMSPPSFKLGDGAVCEALGTCMMVATRV